MSEPTFAGLQAKLRHCVKYDGGGCVESCTACYAERLEKRVQILAHNCESWNWPSESIAIEIRALLGTGNLEQPAERKGT